MPRASTRRPHGAAAERQNAEIDAFREEFTSGDPDAIVSYFHYVLERSSYPEAFPQQFRIGASVSKSPAELVPVRPVLEFDMVDKRFIEASDVLSELDQRPNLMELTSSEFEELITNLFSRMGLESRLTQASRDGGLDCVAFDRRRQPSVPAR